ncbi:MAG: CHAP domain-containing protein [Acidocella sp.]|nr:CHAP domain-containing protein [Acidocella sp.]
MARYRHSGLQCVPYAREVSHIELTGNAFLWWAEAAGRYERGNTPVEGAVLNFRAIGRMPLGHVAVVTGVINNRTILVTQANWVPGTITNDVTVQDVSPDNNWSEVEVELGDSSTWGAAYPTYGFIYDKPASATVIAANGQGNEVAEAPSVRPVNTEGPNRNLQ